MKDPELSVCKEEDEISTEEETSPHNNLKSSQTPFPIEEHLSTSNDSSVVENKFKFNPDAFRGELILSKTVSTITINVYKNLTAFKTCPIHSIPVIFVETCQDNVFYLKQQCETVLSHKNLQTALERMMKKMITLNGAGPSLLKEAMNTIHQISKDNENISPLSNKAQRLSLISYNSILLLSEKNQYVENEAELSSFYKHNFIIVFKGLNLTK